MENQGWGWGVLVKQQVSGALLENDSEWPAAPWPPPALPWELVPTRTRKPALERGALGMYVHAKVGEPLPPPSCPRRRPRTQIHWSQGSAREILQWGPGLVGVMFTFFCQVFIYS